MKILLLVVFSFLISIGSVLAQCVMDPIRTQSVEGYAVFGFRGKYRFLNNARVLLISESDKTNIIKTSAVRDDGYFNIGGVQPGRYILSAQSEAMISAYVDLTVSEKDINNPKDKLIIFIVLSADATKECGGASITIESKTNIERIVKTAKR
jgi:hypothetical protein